jgi:hypothetical protein
LSPKFKTINVPILKFYKTPVPLAKTSFVLQVGNPWLRHLKYKKIKVIAIKTGVFS